LTAAAVLFVAVLLVVGSMLVDLTYIVIRDGARHRSIGRPHPLATSCDAPWACPTCSGRTPTTGVLDTTEGR
jgi:hypothetical protein